MAAVSAGYSFTSGVAEGMSPKDDLQNLNVTPKNIAVGVMIKKLLLEQAQRINLVPSGLTAANIHMHILFQDKLDLMPITMHMAPNLDINTEMAGLIREIRECASNNKFKFKRVISYKMLTVEGHDEPIPDARAITVDGFVVAVIYQDTTKIEYCGNVRSGVMLRGIGTFKPMYCASLGDTIRQLRTPYAFGMDPSDCWFALSKLFKLCPDKIAALGYKDDDDRIYMSNIGTEEDEAEEYEEATGAKATGASGEVEVTETVR